MKCKDRMFIRRTSITHQSIHPRRACQRRRYWILVQFFQKILTKCSCCPEWTLYIYSPNLSLAFRKIKIKLTEKDQNSVELWPRLSKKWIQPKFTGLGLYTICLWHTLIFAIETQFSHSCHEQTELRALVRFSWHMTLSSMVSQLNLHSKILKNDGAISEKY